MNAATTGRLPAVHADAYLARIGYDGPRTPDAVVLRGLHRAHMLAVPFENLDIGAGRPIVLDVQRFFEKIVTRRRGGFCYELNGLFASLLSSLEFRVSLLSARVYSGAAPGPEFDHMALLVDCGERWLADVGFGDSFVEPLRLDSTGIQAQAGQDYRIGEDGGRRRVLRRAEDGTWTTSYDFTLQPRTLGEFALMCHWQQTSPESHFTQKRVCSLATPEGRITLTDTHLIVTARGERHERPLAGDAEFAAALKETFGIGAP